MKKVLLINGSPRRNGNTAAALAVVETALLDRGFYAAANFGQLFAGKPACAVAACWRAGATLSIDRINKYFTFSQMPVVSSEYWNGYLGPGDSFGIGVLKTLAANLARMLEKE